MKPQDIIFFNKEGYPHNLVWDASRSIWTGKLLFDPNSSDTYKTLGMYTFERVPAVEVEEPMSVSSFQYFNDAGAEARPGGVSAPISAIRAVNVAPGFSTKWVYGDNIHSLVRAGDVVQFVGVAYPPFAETNAWGLNLFVVLGHKKDALLVQGGETNDVFVDLANPDGTPVGALRTVDALVLDESSAYYNAGLDYTSMVAGSRFTVVGSKLNDGVYSAAERFSRKKRSVLQASAADLPAITDRGATLGLRVLLRSELPVAFEGGLRVDGQAQTMYFDKRLSSAPAVGSALVIEGGLEFYTVTEVDKALRYLRFSEQGATDYSTYNGSGTPGYVPDLRLQYANNELDYAVDYVPDQTTLLPSHGYTAARLVSASASALAAYDIELAWDDDSNTLRLRSRYAEDYVTASLVITLSSGQKIEVATSQPRHVYVLPVGQELSAETLPATTSAYMRVFDFTRPGPGDSIDSYGLHIGVNGRTWTVATESDDDATAEQWLTNYGAEAAKLGLVGSYNAVSDQLSFTADYPNVPAVMTLKLGSTSVYSVLHSSVEVVELETKTLTVTVNGVAHVVPSLPTIFATVASWVTTHAASLKTAGVTVRAVGPVFYFGTLDPEKRLRVTVQNKYVKLPGDASLVVRSFRQEQVTGCVISCCSVSAASAGFSELGFSTGQVVSLSSTTADAHAPMYIQYTVIGASDTRLYLSYQGPFWRYATPVDVRVSGAAFLREPRHGEQASGTNPRLVYTWGDTHAPAMFFYDFSGQQLPGLAEYRHWEASSSSDDFATYARKHYPQLPAYAPATGILYTGPRPLVGEDVDSLARLSEEYNLDPAAAGSPAFQRTVFDSLAFDLYYTDDDEDITSAPEPLQTFVGYRSLDEGVDRAQIGVYLHEDRALSFVPEFIPNTSLVDNEVVFHSSGLVEALNTDPGATSFMAAGFEPGQLVTVAGADATDSFRRVHLANNGRTYRVLEVRATSLLLDVTDVNMDDESSVKRAPVAYAPYTGADGAPRTELRGMTVTFTQAPTPVAEFVVLGQTEVEDERYKLALENVGRGINPKDLFIFKEYDIAETGVDWIVLNRKRKELLQVQSEIYNYLSSYKAVTAAIDYFGYSDLDFAEYFLNIDGDSKDFGKLFSSELLDLLNRSVPGHTKKNANALRLPNEKYRKTNLFSLAYRITDDNGDFVEGYSFDEVTTKLFGLQKWLEDNVIPIGSRIADINGRAVAVTKAVVKHETYHAKHVRNADGFSPVVARVVAYRSPVQTPVLVNSNPVSTTSPYVVTVKCAAADGGWPDAVHLRVTTYGLQAWMPTKRYFNHDVVYSGDAVWEYVAYPPSSGNPLSDPIYWRNTTKKWDAASEYSPGDTAYSDGQVWQYVATAKTTGNPLADGAYWKSAKNTRALPVQLVDRTVYSADDSVVLTLNKEIDPHFTVEVTSFNGYAGSWREAKTYSIKSGVLVVS